MKLIGLIMQKGGAGKSTAAIALSGALAKTHKVALVDLDEQGSVATWSRFAEGAVTISGLDVFTATSAKDLKKDLSEYDYVVVDTAGVLSGEAIPYLDLAIIPVSPSPFDVWAASNTVALIKARPELKAVFLINRMQSHTVLGKEIVDVIEGYEIDVLPAQLNMRAAHPTSVAKSQLPVDQPSIRLECLRLAKAVKNVLGDK